MAIKIAAILLPLSNLNDHLHVQAYSNGTVISTNNSTFCMCSEFLGLIRVKICEP